MTISELLAEITTAQRLTFLSHSPRDNGPIYGAFETKSARWFYARPFDLDEDLYARFALVHLSQRKGVSEAEPSVLWTNLEVPDRWYRLAELPFAVVLKFEYRPGIALKDWSTTEEFFRLQPWTESDVNNFLFSFEPGLFDVRRGE